MYTPTATAQWSSAVFLNWTALGNNSLFVKNLKISAVNEDADLLNGYSQTAFVRLAAANISPTNGNFAIGSASGRNFIQSHNSQPLDINPIGNNVIINSAAGNVGIGTESPNSKLDLNGIALMYQSGQTSIKTYPAVAGLQLVGYQSDPGTPFTKTSDIVANADGTVPSQMRLFTKASGSSSASERVRITSDGNVGIGTTDPLSKLHIIGTHASNVSKMRFRAGSDDGFLIEKVDNIDVDTGLYLQASSNTGIFMATGGGNVGIGTTSPTEKLHVAGKILMSGTSLASAILGGIQASYGGNANYPTLYGSEASRWVMHINPHISYVQSGTFGYTGTMTGATIRMAAQAAATQFWDIGVGTNSVGEDKFSIGRSGTALVNIDNAGNVGIGTTTPQRKLEVVVPLAGGDIFATSGSVSAKIGVSNNTAGVFIGSQTNHKLELQTNNNTKMSITTSGNVGIGTTAPSALLSVGAGTGNPLSNQFAAVIRGHNSASRTLYLDGSPSASM